MTLALPTQLPDGRQALVSGELLELQNRLQKGDPVAGWRGDKNMAVCVNHLTQQVEVLHVDAEGTGYVAATTGPEDGFMYRLLEKIVKGDWRRGMERWEELDKENQAKRRAIQSDREAQAEEAAERLAWALQRDMEGTNLYGHYFPSKEESHEAAA